ncbi:MAG: glycosyltransferase family 39 protein [Candidatus Pacebacteria bacterium]|jgi:4-amino-4-deoxy-L-arabinose transferase-like glycosyltransferase|nr:glycosyltransferase family 39 protein [Candidatus Paceibacterota bacterium]
MNLNSRWITGIFLGLIMLVTIFTRIYKLDTVPPGLWPDEALNGVQAIFEPYHLFYPENNGREGLIMALDAISFKFLGISMFAFRLVPAILGILTVLGVFFVAYELFRKKNLALLAAFFTATSFWHINFSRINFRAIMLPLILCWSFYFLLMGMRKKNWWPFAASGMVFGIGFYTYSSFRLAPFILLAVIAVWWLASRKEKARGRFFGQASLMLLATFFTALPIGLYFLNGRMDEFYGRLGPISVFSLSSPVNAIIDSTWRHLVMFNIYGDPNWRHNFAGDPQLFLPVGIMFLIGIYLLFKNGIGFLKTRDWRGLAPYATLSAWFGVMLLPGILTYEGLPHALRVIGTIPACYILAALGGVFAYDRLKTKIEDKNVLAVTVVAFLLFAGIAPVYRYFGQWAQSPRTIESFSSDLVAVGNYLKANAGGYDKYVVMYGGDLPAKTIQFVSLTAPGNENTQYIWPGSVRDIATNNPAYVIFMNRDQEAFDILKNKYPDGDLKIEPKTGVWVYYFNQ